MKPFFVSFAAASTRASAVHADVVHGAGDQWRALFDRVDAAPHSVDVAIVAALCGLIFLARVTGRWTR